MGEVDKPIIHSRKISICELKGEVIRELEEKNLIKESEELYGCPVQYQLLITKDK